MTTVHCPAVLIERTLNELRAAGQRGTEGIVLWLAPRPVTAGSTIVETYVPVHEAAVDFFHIPPEGMQALMAHLRRHKLGLAAQVHSHPGRAFHSRADDTWAIVRHEGALSVVVPNFAAGVTVDSFLQVSTTFRLELGDEWREVINADLAKHLRVS